MSKCRLWRWLLTVVSYCLLVDGTSDLRSASEEIKVLAHGLVLGLAASERVIVKIIVCFF